MIDYFLRTSTKSNMEACLIAAGIATRNASGEIVAQWDGGRVDIDFIGSIYSDGEVVDSRYHANLRVCGEMTQEQLTELPIIETPITPMRVFG